MARRPFLLLLMTSLGVASQAASAPTASEVVTNTINGFIVPAYQQFSSEAGALTQAVDALCTAPGEAALSSARQNFAGLVDAWSEVEIIRFGPITEENRLERMLFWPDRKGIGLKQVQRALAEEDQTAANLAQISSKSIAMQGLGALEFLLSGTDSELLAKPPASAYRCRFAEAVAGNIADIATKTLAGWTTTDGFAAKWARPGADNAVYRNGTEAVTELLEVFVNGLELVRDVRVGGFLGLSPEDDKPRQALFWRSGLTVASLGGNLAGMQRLFTASGIAAALPADRAAIADRASFQLGAAVAAAAEASGPLTDLLADPTRRRSLNTFKVMTSSLSDVFGRQMAGALGLTVGFSSLDGD